MHAQITTTTSNDLSAGTIFTLIYIIKIITNATNRNTNIPMTIPAIAPALRQSSCSGG